MRILVCGSRTYRNSKFLSEILDAQLKAHPSLTIVHGNAPGADTLAKDWARKNAVADHAFPADWQRYGHSAGPIRNQQMINEGKPDLVIAFTTGSGPGTRNMIFKAKSAGIHIHEIEDF